ncbi:MAG: hypothetical protein K2Y02_01300 [Burkholderiaceae bacterium]|nr:hypothetical protein [Burkholderiaceae bacterium]
MPKSRLVLLDANVVIGLFELKLWDALVARYEVLIAETCVGEALWYEDGEHRIDIDLAPYVADNRITTVSVDMSAVQAFSKRFEPNYLEKLDPGELESLTHLLATENPAAPCQICSGDRIVYRVLGNLGKGELGISLEELMGGMGRTMKMSWRFTKAFREDATDQGFKERMRGLGVKGPSAGPKKGW